MFRQLLRPVSTGGKNDSHTRTRKPGGANAKDRRQREATAELAALFVPKKQ